MIRIVLIRSMEMLEECLMSPETSHELKHYQALINIFNEVGIKLASRLAIQQAMTYKNDGDFVHSRSLASFFGCCPRGPNRLSGEG